MQTTDTLRERLRRWEATRPVDAAVVYLADAEQQTEQLGYATLMSRVRRLAATLAARLAPADRVLVAPRSEPEYLIALLACLDADMIAIPTLVPANERALARIRAHGEDAGASALLADTWAMERARQLGGPGAAWLGTLQWIGTAGADEEPAAPRPTAATVSEIAYLQYTSGSTGQPKGAMVTHRNLANQLAVLEQALAHRPGEAICNWMPLHHDFGLVMSLQALYSGGTAVLLPPVAAVQRPERWLNAIGRYRAVTSAAPNFMFARCVERIAEERLDPALDLSGLRNVLNAAEPIQADAVRAFERRFGAWGYRASAWRAAFGLAEATLMVSMAPAGAGRRIERFSAPALLEQRAIADAEGRELVSCGTPLQPDSVVIVDPEQRIAVPESIVGEIWVSSESVVAGYWQRPAETDACFAARRGDGHDPRAYLRTGDLGFLWKGELYIAGRLKDLLIVRGENHYPQDIEHCMAQAHADLEPNAAAAFALEGEHGEELVVVSELRREALRRADSESIFAAVRHAVAEAHGLDCAHVVLLRPNGLPRTSSGKVQRRTCRRDWLAGALPVVAQWRRPSAHRSDTQPVDALEESLAACCRELLGVAHIDPQTSLFDYGMDSLKAAELLLLLQERWRLALDLADLAGQASVARLALAIRSGKHTAGAPARTHVADASNFYLGDGGDIGSPADAALLERVRAYVGSWEGTRSRAESVLVGRNTGGKRPPLFWIFQGQQEWQNLAQRMGPEQPLYGLRSGHQIMDYTEANVQALATAYRREIESVQADGPYLVGGNCQGGLIALAIAQQWWRLQRPVALLALLEWAFPPQPYAGRVALLWGAASREKNPYFKFRHPELLWRRLYGAHTVDIIAGGHGEFFNGAPLDALAARLSERIEEALVAPGLFLPRSSAAAARVRLLEAPSRVQAGATFIVKLAIGNAGATPWPATPDGGPRVANHWRDADGNVTAWLDGDADLPALRAGDEAPLTLRARAPAQAGVYLLEIDLAEDGVAWFSNRGLATPRREIVVLEYSA